MPHQTRTLSRARGRRRAQWIRAAFNRTLRRRAHHGEHPRVCARIL